MPQKSFSRKENRPLDQLPPLEIRSVLSGDYFDALNGFYQDQFPMRDGFTSLHALAERGWGKIETNGVITTNDGICVALPKANGIQRAKKNIDSIYALKEERELYLYVPPSTFDVFKEKLPKIYPKDTAQSAAELLRGDELTDFLELTEIADEEYYYKTDHHWTTKGAYFAYTQICERMGITAYAEDCFARTLISKTFLGTSAAKSGLPAWLISADSITLYRYNGDTDITVENHETAQLQNGFYSYEALNEADKYKVFLGGNYSHLSIRSNTEHPTLLLIKDSFSNSVIPFLSLHFNIEVIDPRYCTQEYLERQLKREDVDKTLILMGLDTLTTNIFK